MTRERAEGWLGGLSPLPRAPLAERAYGQILEQILAGRIGAGEHLVEQALAEQLGISRIGVREALRQLAHEGLIEIILNRGAYVRRFTAEDIELMGLSRQRRAYAIWQDISAQITMVVYSVSSDYPSFEGLAARHQRIVDLIRAQDGPALTAYLRRHILEGGQHLVDALRQQSAGS